MIRCSQIGILLVCLWITSALALSIEEELNTDLIGLTTSEIIRLRGFEAEDHYVEVTGGYKLNVVHAWNPLIKNTKKTILMIHGIITNANCFITNSIGARPRDNSSIDFATHSLEELNQLFAYDPNANSLVFLGLNNGFDFWMVNRRGSEESMGQANGDMQPFRIPIPNIPIIHNLLHSRKKREGLTTKLLSELSLLGADEVNNLIKSIPDVGISALGLLNFANSRYWDYSLDEQAKYDIPQVVKYILHKVKRSKLSIVGHSAGAALVLMALVVEPELGKFLDKVHLWGPALDLGDTSNRNTLLDIALPLVPLIRDYRGPVPPISLSKILQNSVSGICTPPVIRDTLCAAAPDILVGKGGFQQKIYPGLIDNYFVPTSSHELTQLAQSIRKKTMHFFEYPTIEENVRKYGQPKPPEYNISKIVFDAISLWAGNTDILVTPLDVVSVAKRLTVRADLHFINQTGVFFNHASYLVHKNISQLLIIETMKSLST